jgi:hypothetical protein
MLQRKRATRRFQKGPLVFGATVSSAGGLSPGRLWSLWEMVDTFGHSCACVMRGTMEVEQRLQEMLSIDPLSPVTIPGGEVSSENPAFFVSVHLDFIKTYANELNLRPTLNRCSRLMLTLPVEKHLSNVHHQLVEIRRQFEDDLRSRHFLSIGRGREILGQGTLVRSNSQPKI